MIRFRFSLRVLLTVTTFFAGFCYYWIVMPGATAKRFVDSIAAEDYKAADGLFWIASDRTLSEWKDKRWAFRSKAELLPLTFWQLLSGHREMLLHITYFQFDQNHDLDMRIAATSFGMKSPSDLSSNSALTIDSLQFSLPATEIK
jgi:hypothetical protein